jgi:hypothetical protein
MKKEMKRFHLVGLASLLMLGLLFIQIGLGGAKASAESNFTPAISNSESTSKTLTQLSGRPWVNWGDGVGLPTAYTGAAGLTQVLERGLAQPLALASADFDEDGVPDLVSGYAGPSGGIVTLHRGNLYSIYPNAPQTQDPRPKTQDFHDQPPPFLSPARVFEVPEAPEFLGAGDFDNDGHWDVVAAARGSKALHLLSGDGRGGFASAKAIALPGAVTTLTTGEINRRDGLTDVVVGIIGRDGPAVLIFEWPEGALRGQPEVFPLPAEATALALGQLDDSYEIDLAVAAGSELVIVRGRDRKLSLDAIKQAEVPPAIVEQRSFPFAITSLALGDFVWDEAHQTDIAVLADDGAVHVLTNPTRWVGTAGAHREAPLQRSVRASVPGRPPTVDVKRRYLESRPLALWPSEILTPGDQRPATNWFAPKSPACRPMIWWSWIKRNTNSTS